MGKAKPAPSTASSGPSPSGASAVVAGFDRIMQELLDEAGVSPEVRAILLASGCTSHVFVGGLTEADLRNLESISPSTRQTLWEGVILRIAGKAALLGVAVASVPIASPTALMPASGGDMETPRVASLIVATSLLSLGARSVAPIDNPRDVAAPVASMGALRIVEIISHSIDKSIVVAGAQALCELTGGARDRAARVRSLLRIGVSYVDRCAECVSAGAVACLIDAMRRYGNSSSVWQSSSRALCNLAATSDGLVGVVPHLVDALSTRVKSRDRIIAYTCDTFASIANSAVSAEVLTSGAVPHLLALMRTHSSDDSIALAVCRALRGVASLSECMDVFTASGVLPSISRLIARHASHKCPVLESAASIILHVATFPAGREAALAAGVLPHLSTALRGSSDNALVCNTLCCAISNLALSFAGATGVLDAGVMPHLVSALGTHETIITITRAATGTIRAICDVGQGGPSQAFACGAITRLVAALRLYPTDARIACYASGAIQVIGSIREGRHEALENMALHHLVGALRLQATDVNVVCWTLRAIGVVASDGADSRSSPLGIVPDLLPIFRIHSSNHLVIRLACQAIRNISRSGYGQVATLQALPCLLTALDTHPSDIDIAVGANFAIGAIASASANVSTVLAAGAVPRLLVSLRTHQFDSDVTEACFDAMSQIATSDAGKEAALGCAPLLLSALRNHTFSSSVHKLACRILAHLAILPAGEGFFLESEVIAQLVTCLRAPIVMSVAAEACRAIWNAAIRSDALRRVAINSGALPRLLEVFRADGFEEPCYFAAGAICALSVTHEDRTVAVDTGVVPPLIILLENELVDDARHAERVCAALLNVVVVPAGRAEAMENDLVPSLVSCLERYGIAECPSAHAVLQALGFSDSGDEVP